MAGQNVLLFAVIASVGVCWSNFSVGAIRKCCLPNKYSMEVTLLNTVNSDFPTVLDTQMDYDTQQMVALNYTYSIDSPSGRRSPDSWDLKILIDFNKSRVYLVPGDRPDQCSVYPYLEKLQKCIPDDAVYLTSGYMGSPGSAGLTYDAWRFRTPMVSKGAAVGHGQQALMVTLAMTRDCVPIIEGVHVLANPATDQLYTMNNFTPNLTNPGAFKLPDSCFQVK